MSWVTLATAPGQLQAEMWLDMLQEQGIGAVIHSGDTASFLGVSSYPCRVMVMEEDLERAKQALTRKSSESSAAI